MEVRGEKVRSWKVGELAERTGLSVRTLHYYDEIGLLAPSRRSESGYRLYGAKDIERLRRITSLKSLGLPLEEVRAGLDGGKFSPVEVLREQVARLDQEISLKKTLRERLHRISSRLQSESSSSTEELLQAIKEMEVSERVEKFYTQEQLDYLAKRKETVGEERIKEVEAEWPRLMDEVRAEMEKGTSPEDPRARELARRWMGLVEEFTGGNDGVRRSLGKMWNEEKEIHGIQTAGMRRMFAYVQEALAADER